MRRRTRRGRADTKRNLLRQLLEVARLMRRARMGPSDALDILADGLRPFADYERHREAADDLPFPVWKYGQDPT